MRMFVDPGSIYLHRDVVDFRKSINGLVTIVEQEMQLSPFTPALFVFCNRNRDRIKVLYWDRTGFCLWYKRLEKERFKWPRHYADPIMLIDEAQWQWLLSGYDLVGHTPLHFTSCTGKM
jgi:transposase